MMYYCEVFPYIDDPYFKGWRCEADSDECALAFFREQHGDKLVFVYDEDYRTVFEKKA